MFIKLPQTQMYNKDKIFGLVISVISEWTKYTRECEGECPLMGAHLLKPLLIPQRLWSNITLD